MLYHLFDWLKEEGIRFPGVELFRFITFRTMVAVLLSLFITLVYGKKLIQFLQARQFSEGVRNLGLAGENLKKDTPTMGGIIIIFATAVGYFIAHAISRNTVSTSALLVLGLMAGLGFVGFLDDWLKVSRQKSLGLNAKQKIFGQIVVAATFAYLGINFPDRDGLTPISQNLSTVRDTSITLGTTLVIIWVVIMVTATSNGVNLTDGLDGLATGAAVMTFIAFILIGVWEFGQSCAVSPGANCYLVRDPLDIAVLSAALAGACAGFLWWNASPAKIFMGDTGSLALGGALAGIATT